MISRVRSIIPLAVRSLILLLVISVWPAVPSAECNADLSPGLLAPLVIEESAAHSMTGFYESLGRTERGDGVTRVIHYGDSHVAADLLTGELKRLLHLSFGDAGPGFMLAGRPWSWYSREGVISRSSDGWTFGGVGTASLETDGRFGLGGVCASAERTGEWLSLTASARSFDLYFLKQPLGGAIQVILDGESIEDRFPLRDAASEPTYLNISTDDQSVHSLEIRTVEPGPVRVLGVAVEADRPGVTYDVLGINGARASRPLSWDWQVLASNLERRDPDLIIIAYGSNEVTDSDLDLNRYEASFAEMLNRFHEAVPRASLLVIGPPDRAVRVENRWKSARHMQSLVAAQRRAARESGAAFVDLFRAMGGSGSIDRWSTRSERLAQADRVHLTREGYKLVAQALYRAIMKGYTKMRA
jgi:lysophospholipase L1-like esterase